MDNESRIGENGNATGKYELVARIHNSTTDPGGTVTIEFYISGYGNIGGAKLAFYPPIGNLLASNSFITASLGRDPSTELLTWGHGKTKINNTGFVLQVDGRRGPKGERLTMFFDAKYPEYEKDYVPQIITEKSLGENTIKELPSQFNAPFVLTLGIDSKARAGTYYTSAILTYFDGERWQTSTVQPSFSIRTLFQRHEKKIAWLGVIAALGSGSGLIQYLKPIGCWIMHLYEEV